MNFFIVLVKSYLISLIRLQRVMKKEWFLCFLRSLLINYLITLSLEKEIIVLEKLLEKVLNFGSKKQSVRTLPPGSLCTDPLPSGKIGGGGEYVHRLLPEQFSSLK